MFQKLSRFRQVHIFIIVFYSLVQRLEAQQCGKHQLSWNNQCTDCTDVIHGCSECSFQPQEHDQLHCEVCDYGYYMLTIDDTLEGSKNFIHGYNPKMRNVCVKSCEDFAHNYVSNPNTMRCEYCGKNCKRCTLLHGCVDCLHGYQIGKGAPSVSYYKDLVEKYGTTQFGGNQLLGFPYSVNEFTSNKGPSSQFQTCAQCDPRCNDCGDFVSQTERDLAISQLDCIIGEIDPETNQTIPCNGEDDLPVPQCKSCPYHIQSQSDQQSNRACLLYPSNVENCIQGAKDDPDTCEACKDGFRLSSPTQCSPCSSRASPSQGCMRCNDDGSRCAHCMEGFHNKNGKCDKSDSYHVENNLYTNSPAFTFGSQRIVNFQDNDNFGEDWWDCGTGFRDSTAEYKTQFLNARVSETQQNSGRACRIRCGLDQFPFIEKNTRGNQQKRRCKNCHSQCTKCNGETNQDCLECPPGKYLAINDPQTLTGSCRDKQNSGASFDIYVSNLIDESISEAQQRSGTFEDPFAHLVDAFKRAKGLAAPYKRSVAVRIHLFSGKHFVIQNRYDAFNIYQESQTIDPFQQNIDMEIKPLSCSHQPESGADISAEICTDTDKVTIYNKIRERLIFEVFSSLKMERVTIDSIDSILPLNTPCLSEYRRCCKIENPDINNHGVTDFSTPENCAQNFESLKLSDDCKNPDLERTFMRFVDTKNRGIYNAFSGNFLSLQSVTISNIFYGMNSLINVTESGAKISIKDTKFEHLHICGSILKNTAGLRPSSDLSQLNDGFINGNSKNIKVLYDEFQYAMLQQYQEVYQTALAPPQPYTDQSIEITDNSIFNLLNFQSQKVSQLSVISPDSLMKFQALVLSLENFAGPITISDSQFTDNIFRFESCLFDSYDVLLNDFITPQLTISNNVRYLPRTPQTVFSEIQLKSLIHISKHSHALQFSSNSFERNTGSQGIIFLESRSQDPVLIHNNTFEMNSGLVGSNVLTMRKLVDSKSDIVRSQYGSISNVKCGGFQVSSNTFFMNVGCKDTHGSIHLYCYDGSNEALGDQSWKNLNQMEMLSKKELMRYDPILDMQYFIGDFSDPQAQSPSNFQPSFKAFQVGEESMNINKQAVIFKDNSFLNNLAGSRRSVVQIEGFPLFESIGDYFFENDNWFQVGFDRLSTLKQFSQDASISDKVYGLQDFTEYKDKSKSILTVWRALSLKVQNTTFDRNFVVDDVDPTSEELKDSFQKSQSQGLLVVDFTGDVSITGQTAFENCQGASNSSTLKDFVSDFYTFRGFKSRVLSFYRYKFTKTEIDGLKFVNNKAYSYEGSGLQSIRPRLLEFTEEDHDEGSLSLRNIEISQNIFKNSDCMVYILPLDITYSDFILKDNGIDVAEDTNESIIKAAFSPEMQINFQNMTIEGNKVGKGSVFKFQLTEESEFTPDNACKDGPNIAFTSSSIQNNTSGSTTSLVHFEDAPWLWLRFEETSMVNNFGQVTNEIYSKRMRRVDFLNSTWGQLPEPSETRWNSAATVNKAKFIFMNDTYFHLNIQNSVFDCNVPYDQRVVYTMNAFTKKADSSVFHIVKARDDSKMFCLQDAQELGAFGSEDIHHIFDTNDYQNCNQATMGGIFHLNYGAKIQIIGEMNTMTQNSAIYGGFAYLKGVGTSIDVTSPSQFIGQNAYYGGAFALYNQARLTIQNSEDHRIQKLEGSNVFDGVIFFEDRSNVTLINVEFSENIAVERGVLSSHSSSKLSVEKCYFYRNEAEFDAVILFVDGGRDTMIWNWEGLPPEEEEGDDHEDGAEGYSEHYEHSVQKYTTIETWQSYFSDCVIEENKMEQGGNMIKIIETNFLVNNSQFIENRIDQKSGGIHAMYSDLTIKESYFTDNQPILYYIDPNAEYFRDQRSDSVYGGYVYIGPNSTLVSENNEYRSTRSIVGGCVAIIGASYAQFKGDSFQKCIAVSGGAIAAIDFKDLTIDGCEFSNDDTNHKNLNVAFSGKGDNIFAQRFHGMLKIVNSNFAAGLNSIWIEQGKELYVDSVNIVQKFNLLTQNAFSEWKYGGGFHIVNMFSIEHFNDVDIFMPAANQNREKFKWADYGGCIYIGLEHHFKQQFYNLAPYYMSNLILEGCQATKGGGGMHIDNVKHLIFTGTSRIEDNYAGEFGGGINFVCPPDDSEVSDCNITLTGVTVTKNKANEGGGIYYQDVVPNWSDSQFYGNNAKLYGNQKASFATQLVQFIPFTAADPTKSTLEGQTDEAYFQTYFETRTDISIIESFTNPLKAAEPVGFHQIEKSKNLEIPSIQSGGFIHRFYLALLDQEQQVVTSNRGSKVSIDINDIKTTIEGPTRFFSSFGVFNISGMIIKTTPGAKNIIMTVEAEKRAIKAANNDELRSIKYNLLVMKCKIGEEQIKDGENFICRTCPDGKYLLKAPPENTVMTCKTCPQEKAKCVGGARVGPRAKYWRKSASSNEFSECFEPTACLGLFLDEDQPLFEDRGYSPTGNCAEGYYGALCSACMPNYMQYDGFKCQTCGSKRMNIMRVVFVMIGAAAAISFLVKSTIEGQEQRQTHSVFVKILINHTTAIYIISTFDMKWPPEMTNFLQKMGILMELQRLLVAFDCFLDPRDPESVDIQQFEAGPDEFRITYWKLLMYASMPLVLGLIAISTWYVILWYQERYGNKPNALKGLYDRFISTLVILLFLVHPQITEYMIGIFNCQKFDGVQRLMPDPQIVCFQHMHRSIGLPVAGVCIIAWGIGIPALIYILMAKEKENLATVAVKMKFGFLYNGYKKDNFYWEIIIMYRKIVCFFIAVALRNTGIIVQGFVLLIMLVIFYQLNGINRPFGTRALNEVEDASLLTQIITIYCGLFFISEADTKSSTYNPSKDFTMKPPFRYTLILIIVLANIGFLALWSVKFLLTLRSMIKSQHPKMYLFLFLCCRKDKLVKEEAKIAREAKRETIIEKIEEIQFFVKHMKEIYSKEIYYEGHDKFLDLLYYIENQRKHVDLTVKRHNLYIQGEIARERKLDPTRIKEAQDNPELVVDAEKGGNDLVMNKIKSILRSFDIKKKETKEQQKPILDQPDLKVFPDDMINIKKDKKKKREGILINVEDFQLNNQEENIDFSNELDKTDEPLNKHSNQYEIFKSGQIKINKMEKPPSMMSDVKFENPDRDQRLMRLDSNEPGGTGTVESGTIGSMTSKQAMVQFQKENALNDPRRIEEEDGMESEVDEEAAENQPKYKKPNDLNIEDVIKKSRNAKSRINYEHKSRIFAEDLRHGGVKQYMKEHFELFVEEEIQESQQEWDENSPEKSPSKDKIEDQDAIEQEPTENIKEFGQKEEESIDLKVTRGRELELVQSPTSPLIGDQTIITPKKENIDSDSDKKIGLDSNVGISKSSFSKGRDREDASPEDRKRKKVSFPERTSKGTKPTPDDHEEDSEMPEPVEDESGLLTLSILDSADSKEVYLNYQKNREKQTEAAFVGSYSDRDSNEDGGTKKGKGKKEKKKRRVDTPDEEFKDVQGILDISTSTQRRMDSKFIGKDKTTSQNNTVNTQNAKNYPGKSESFAKSQSVATLGANMKNSGFSHSKFNKTGQTITDDIRMNQNFGSPVVTKVGAGDGPFSDKLSSGSDKEDKHARFLPGRKPKRHHHHVKKTPEEMLQDERDKNVFRELAKIKQSGQPDEK